MLIHAAELQDEFNECLIKEIELLKKLQSNRSVPISCSRDLKEKILVERITKLEARLKELSPNDELLMES